jgi:hypothetical protein
MTRFQAFGVGLGVALLCTSSGEVRPVISTGTASLEGAWQVVSVRQDGADDPTPVGGLLTFAGGEVRFQPAAPRALKIDDGTS